MGEAVAQRARPIPDPSASDMNVTACNTMFDGLETRLLNDPDGLNLANWALRLAPCPSVTEFLFEAQWVILCSGISHKAARTMERTLMKTGTCAHPSKNRAIQKWRENAVEWWAAYSALTSEQKRLAYLRTLPFMGGQALVYQLAKNLGMTSFAKPDRHLIRMADEHKTNPQALCECIAASRGVTVAYVDTVLWYAAARKWWKPE